MTATATVPNRAAAQITNPLANTATMTANVQNGAALIAEALYQLAVQQGSFQTSDIGETMHENHECRHDWDYFSNHHWDMDFEISATVFTIMEAATLTAQESTDLNDVATITAFVKINAAAIAEVLSKLVAKEADLEEMISDNAECRHEENYYSSEHYNMEFNIANALLVIMGVATGKEVCHG